MNYQVLQNAEISASVYLLKGDAFLCNKAKELIAQKLGINGLNTSVFTDENFDANSVINACNQFSFFDEKRMVVLTGLVKELNQDAKTTLQKYINNPNANCVLVLIDSLGSKFFDTFKNVEVVECTPTEYYITNHIKSQFAQKGYEISDQNASKLSTWCLGNLSRINVEIKKICDFLGENKTVTSQTIESLVTKDIEIKGFDLTNALGTKNMNLALGILNEMLMSGDSPIKILGIITGVFRRMMFAKINKGTTQELAKAFGVKEYAIQKAKEHAGNFSASALKDILNLLLNADYGIKSGQMSPENTIYYVVFKICTM